MDTATEAVPSVARRDFGTVAVSVVDDTYVTVRAVVLLPDFHWT